MKSILLASALLSIMLSPVYAQEKAPEPCERGASTMKMGNMDMDTMRCREVIMQNHLGQMEMLVLGLQTDIEMAKKDVANAKKETETTQKHWADYFSTYIGESDVK
jgi:hypothetical protein